MNLCIIDFEATCKENDKSFQMEIIEFGVVIQTPTKEHYFQSFVKPVVNPILTYFCKNLTSIRQQDVDNAPRFQEVLNDLLTCLAVLGGENWRDDTLFCSWGVYDKKQLIKDCDRHDIKFPFNGWHLNIKQEFKDRYPKVKNGYLGSAAEYLGIPWEGTAHRGIDDAKMIAKVLKAMRADGYKLPAVITKSLEGSLT